MYLGNPMATKYNDRIIFHLTLKEKYFHRPQYSDIQSNLYNLKLEARTFNQLKIAMPTIASGLDGCVWTIIKQLIYSEFEDSEI